MGGTSQPNDRTEAYNEKKWLRPDTYMREKVNHKKELVRLVKEFDMEK